MDVFGVLGRAADGWGWDMSDQNPLEFVTTEDMLKELFRRFDGVLVVLESDNDMKEESTVEFHWDGSICRALGMAECARVRILEHRSATKYPGELNE